MRCFRGQRQRVRKSSPRSAACVPRLSPEFGFHTNYVYGVRVICRALGSIGTLAHPVFRTSPRQRCQVGPHGRGEDYGALSGFETNPWRHSWVTAESGHSQRLDSALTTMPLCLPPPLSAQCNPGPPASWICILPSLSTTWWGEWHSLYISFYLYLFMTLSVLQCKRRLN